MGRSRSPQAVARRRRRRRAPGFLLPRPDSPGSSVPVAALCSYRSPVRPALSATTIHACPAILGTRRVPDRASRSGNSSRLEFKPGRGSIARSCVGGLAPVCSRTRRSSATGRPPTLAVPVGGYGSSSSSTIRQKRLEDIFGQRVITDNISVNALGANMRFVQVNSSRIVQKWVPAACWSVYTAGDKHVRCPRGTYCTSTAGHRGSMGKRATQEMVAARKKNGGQ